MKYKQDKVYGVLFNTITNDISKTYDSVAKADYARRVMLSNNTITEDVVTRGVRLEFTEATFTNADDYYNLGYEVGYGDKQECSTVPKKYLEDYEEGKTNGCLELMVEMEEAENYFDYTDIEAEE